MTIPELTDRILTQGPALVRAIEALGTIQPSGPFEPALARLLMAGLLQAPATWYREARTQLGQRGDTERVGAHWG